MLALCFKVIIDMTYGLPNRRMYTQNEATSLPFQLILNKGLITERLEQRFSQPSQASTGSWYQNYEEGLTGFPLPSKISIIKWLTEVLLQWAMCTLTDSEHILRNQGEVGPLYSRSSALIVWPAIFVCVCFHRFCWRKSQIHIFWYHILRYIQILVLLQGKIFFNFSLQCSSLWSIVLCKVCQRLWSNKTIDLLNSQQRSEMCT